MPTKSPRFAPNPSAKHPLSGQKGWDFESIPGKGVMSGLRTNYTRMYVDTMHVSLEYTSVFVDTTYDTSRPSRPSPSWNAQYSSSRPLRKRRRPWGTCSALNLPAWRGSRLQKARKRAQTSILAHFSARPLRNGALRSRTRLRSSCSGSLRSCLHRSEPRKGSGRSTALRPPAQAPVLPTRR